MPINLYKFKMLPIVPAYVILQFESRKLPAVLALFFSLPLF